LFDALQSRSLNIKYAADLGQALGWPTQQARRLSFLSHPAKIFEMLQEFLTEDYPLMIERI